MVVVSKGSSAIMLLCVVCGYAVRRPCEVGKSRSWARVCGHSRHLPHDRAWSLVHAHEATNDHSSFSPTFRSPHACAHRTHFDAGSSISTMAHSWCRQQIRSRLRLHVACRCHGCGAFLIELPVISACYHHCFLSHSVYAYWYIAHISVVYSQPLLLLWDAKADDSCKLSPFERAETLLEQVEGPK